MLQRTFLYGANFYRAILSNVDFGVAKLNNVDFGIAKLGNVDFRDAKLEKTIDFTGTVLEGYKYEDIIRKGRSLVLTKEKEGNE